MMRKTSWSAILTVVLLAGIAIPSEALSDVTWSSGSTTRARFYEHAGFSGGTATAVGSTNCTATTSDVDNQFSSSYIGGYNNAISGSKDYNSCDTRIYDSGNWTGTRYGYFDAGSTGVDYSGIGWNDIVSSIELS